MRRTIVTVTVLIGLVMVVLIVALAGRSTTPATSIKGPLVGKAAPSAMGTTLDGARVSLASLRGRPVILNFVASWCGPCRTEAPRLEAFATDQAKLPNGAEVLGITFNDASSAMRNYVTTQGVTYPILTDPNGSIASSFGVASPPTTFVISPSGRVAAELVGAVNVRELDAAVASFSGATGG